eukprot:scaffold24040_cov88-Cylindrotheca_fusiformis.AAC.1
MQGVRFRASAFKDAILHKPTRSLHPKDMTGAQGTKDGSSMACERPSKTISSGDFSISQNSSNDDDSNPPCMEDSIARIEPNGAWALALKDAESEDDDCSLVDSLGSNEDETEEQEDKPSTPEMMSSIDEQEETPNEQPNIRSNVESKLKEWRRKRERFAEDMPRTREVFHQAWILEFSRLSKAEICTDKKKESGNGSTESDSSNSKLQL